MILTNLKLWDFRKFASNGNEPGLEVCFHSGINALIGENDTGKSTIIDAIKLVLQTQSGEFIHIEDDDFYNSDDEKNFFRIDLMFSKFNDNEAKNFIEYLSFNSKASSEDFYILNLHYKAKKEKGRIFTELKAGCSLDDGISLDPKARELLKCIYLRPLRDAEKEMTHGRNSRISQILFNHPTFADKEESNLVKILEDANKHIENFFTEEKGTEILTKIRNNINEFLEEEKKDDTTLRTSEKHLKSILESLSLISSEINPGLGRHNLLFIAAELVLLNTADSLGNLRLALIEELEAHLHPQAQLRLINYLQREYNDSGIQIIISTHSTILASKINIKNIILLKNNKAYDMSPDNTLLLKGDYLFLQRFLDITKANLFFAKGIIMVEGDAENIIIPVIADILGYNLEKYGVSIVNVGSLAFQRYSRIFLRKDNSDMGIPVSIVTDVDIKPDCNDNKEIDLKINDTNKAIIDKQAKYSQKNVQAFVSPNWTFEFSIGLSCLNALLEKSILQAKKIQNSDTYALTEEKMKEVEQDINIIENEKYTKEYLAYYLYNNLVLGKNKGNVNEKSSSISKAIIAQCLASNLRWSIIQNPSRIPIDRLFDIDLYQIPIDNTKKDSLKNQIENDKNLKYIVNAIKHAAGVKNGNNAQ